MVISCNGQEVPVQLPLAQPAAAPPFIAHSIAQYIVSPRTPLIDISYNIGNGNIQGVPARSPQPQLAAAPRPRHQTPASPQPARPPAVASARQRSRTIQRSARVNPKYGILFIFSPFDEYINLEYVRVPVISRVHQAEYVVHFLLVASQEYVNTYSTRRLPARPPQVQPATAPRPRHQTPASPRPARRPAAASARQRSRTIQRSARAQAAAPQAPTLLALVVERPFFPLAGVASWPPFPWSPLEPRSAALRSALARAVKRNPRE